MLIISIRKWWGGVHHIKLTTYGYHYYYKYIKSRHAPKTAPKTEITSGNMGVLPYP
jgi:hypothetical protein